MPIVHSILKRLLIIENIQDNDMKLPLKFELRKLLNYLPLPSHLKFHLKNLMKDISMFHWLLSIKELSILNVKHMT